MPDLTRIIDAFAALARATVSSYVTIIKYNHGGIGIGLAHDSDADARATATALGVELTVIGNGIEEWLRGECHVGDVPVSVFGAHHKVHHAANPEPALAQADEAVSR